MSVITEKGEQTTSYLLIQRAQAADSGNYTCHPSNANTKTVTVHVLSGSYLYLYILYIYFCTYIQTQTDTYTNKLYVSTNGNELQGREEKKITKEREREKKVETERV